MECSRRSLSFDVLINRGESALAEIAGRLYGRVVWFVPAAVTLVVTSKRSLSFDVLTNRGAIRTSEIAGRFVRACRLVCTGCGNVGCYIKAEAAPRALPMECSGAALALMS